MLDFETEKPAADIEATLTTLWADELGCSDVDPEDNYFVLGGDSLRALRLLLRVDEVFGTRLPHSVVFEAPTIREMALLIRANKPASCLASIKRDGTLPPFFCVHDVSGEVLNFGRLARQLGPDRPFFGLQSEGLDGKSDVATRVGDMADSYIQAIQSVQSTGPYYLGGYSLGGTIAFEMARRMYAQGEEVALLVLVDADAPGKRSRASLALWLWRHVQRLRSRPAKEWPSYLGTRIRNLRGMVAGLVRRRTFDLALRRLREDERLPSRFVPEANILAWTRYQPEVYHGDAVLFTATPYAWANPDTLSNWDQLIGGKLETVKIPGQHFEILGEPYVQVLAHELRSRLDKCSEESEVWGES